MNAPVKLKIKERGVNQLSWTQVKKDGDTVEELMTWSKYIGKNPNMEYNHGVDGINYEII